MNPYLFLWLLPFSLSAFRLSRGDVAVTDLFSLANQYPRQAFRPHIDQS